MATEVIRVVDVVDTLDPTISGAKDIVLSNSSTCPSGAVTYNLTASDICDGNLTSSIVCVPPSGSTFPIGVTPVNCTVTDISGNEGTANFNVIVLEIADSPGERILEAVALRR